jgi:hypothetical protein
VAEAWRLPSLAGLTDGERSAAVREYVQVGQRIAALQRARDVARAANKGGCAACDVEELVRLTQRREALRPLVQAIVADQVTRALVSEGVALPGSLGALRGLLFPPVRFVLDDLPLVLIVSPRDRIDSVREAMLVSDLSESDMAALERSVESLEASFAPDGLSALVEEIGGFGGTFPAFVQLDASISFTIGTVAEEWVHQYLAFSPLGRRYILDQLGIDRDYDVARLNEAAAGIAADEVRDRVLYEHYAEPAQGGSAVMEPARPTSSDAFSFRTYMRDTRRVVDGMLAKGELAQAEAYMEARRVQLQQHGYHLRRLNQAYFSFHGTYADGPVSVDPVTGVDPVGAGMRMLRDGSASVGEFLRRAGRITSIEELAAVVAP